MSPDPRPNDAPRPDDDAPARAADADETVGADEAERAAASVPDPAGEPADTALTDLLAGDTPDRLMKGHAYDGIREYDNPMPGWWTWLFIATVLWAPVYALGVHALGFIDDYGDDLAEGQAALEEVRRVYAETGPAFKTDAGALRDYAADPAMQQAGAVTYAAVCAACHGDAGQGLIGPNLADPFWIHGGAPEDVYRVISEGVLAQGMPAWDGQLSEQQQAEAMAFVVSLRGTTPPGAKAPQGERYDGP